MGCELVLQHQVTGVVTYELVINVTCIWLLMLRTWILAVRLLMHSFQFLSESYPKCPWVRIFAHNGTQGLARDGQPLRQEVVHYPYNSTTFAQV